MRCLIYARLLELRRVAKVNIHRDEPLLERAARQHIESGTAVAPSTCRHVGHIVAAESPRTVVTGRAIVTSAGVFLRGDRRYLTALLGRTHVVTFRAIHALRTRVFAMAEHGFENIS